MEVDGFDVDFQQKTVEDVCADIGAVKIVSAKNQAEAGCGLSRYKDCNIADCPTCILAR